MNRMLRVLTLSLAVLPPLAIAPASADAPFDGRWSVRVVAQSAQCSDNYAVPVKVADGRITTAGLFGGRQAGSIGEDGRLEISLHGVHAIGSLGETAGEGKWSSAACTGTWAARRA